MPEDQAKAVAAHLPDWSQFATKQNLSEPESRLIRWMVGIFVGGVTVAGGLPTVLATVANQPSSCKPRFACPCNPTRAP